jgi:1,4-dihydroxy-2-naphthoate polyprenyltransferase
MAWFGADCCERAHGPPHGALSHWARMKADAAMARRPRVEGVVAVLAAFTLMSRPPQIALVAVIYLNGVFLGLVTGARPADAAAIFLGLALVIPVAASVHWANEAADVATDALTIRTPFSGGSGVLPASGIEPRMVIMVALFAAIASLAGAALVVQSSLLPVPALVLLAAGLAGGWAYSLPPVAAARRGWGEPLNAVLGGCLLPLYGVSVVQGVPTSAHVLAVLPFAFVVMASVLATAWPDREADGATGKGTLQVRLAPRNLRRLYAASIAGFGTATVAAATTGAVTMAWLGLAVLPLLLIGYRRYTRLTSPLPSVAAMAGYAGLVLVAQAALLLP